MHGKKKLTKPIENAKKYCVEYTDKSTIHGFRYLSEANRFLAEKIFWTFVMLISFVVCCQMISDILTKYHQSPVIMSIDEKAIPYWDIPFPAVTICPESKSSADYYSIEEFLTRFFYKSEEQIQVGLFKMTDVDRMHLTAMSQICHNLNFTGFDPKNQTECSQCLKIFETIGITREQLINRCTYKLRCKDLFVKTITDEGLCFTFNSLRMEDIFRMSNIDGNYRLLEHSFESQWSLEGGYNPEAPLDTYPIRAMPYEQNDGLDLKLAIVYADHQPLCRKNLEAKIALHAPNEIPQMTKYFQKLPLKHEVLVTVTPQVIRTDENLRNYSPIIRQCFFNDERYLRYFKVYTQQNCKLECLTNSTLEKCGCVQFYMPRGRNVKICGIGEMKCIESIRYNTELSQNMSNSYDPNQCNCWPSCMAITYSSKTSQVSVKNEINLIYSFDTAFTNLKIFNKQEHIFAIRKQEIHSLVGLVSQWGGLLGLFMGISLLSIVELVYHCALRLPCSLWHERDLKMFIPTNRPTSSDASAVDLTCKGVCINYSDNSSIHGFPYLIEQNRPLTEKVFWAIVITASILGCGQLIFEQYKTWIENPMIISISEKPTYIWQIPFPAITICPEAKTDSDLFDIKEALSPYIQRQVYDDRFDDLPDGELRSNIIALSQVCSVDYFSRLTKSTRPSNCSRCLTNLKKISLTKDSIIKSCRYQQFEGDVCKRWIDEIVTDEGICYTFNTLKMADIFRDETILGDYRFLNHTRSSDQWSSEDGYKPDAPLDVYPFRALGIGSKMGITVDMSIDRKHFDEYCKTQYTPSYRMVLHSPDEIPQVSKFYKMLPVENEVVAVIQPKMMTTDENLRSYSPEMCRRCFFNNERYLRYFKIYTQQNCRTECLTNFTLRNCGCVRLHMPRHDGVPICALSDLRCSINAVRNLRDETIEREHQNIHDPSQCNCWPTCTSITYEVEMNQVNLNWNFTEKFYNITEDFNQDLLEGEDTEITRVTLLFKHEQFFSYIRSELFGQTDFFANCGGLLGLFMGVSLLSIVEFVYFFSIRLFCTLRGRHTAI